MTFHDEQDILYFFFVFGGYSLKDDPVLIWFWLFYTLWYGYSLFIKRSGMDNLLLDLFMYPFRRIYVSD